MKHNISVFSLAFLGATAMYSQVTLSTTPARSVGTALQNPESANPNLVEGKELFSPRGIALDTSVTPPILYVADSNNNRVLAWKNATGFTNGQPADMVIGQQDFFATDLQGPGQKFSAGFNAPSGLAVSSTGDLYVVDTNNNRILRYRTPFQKVSSLPAVLTSAPDLFIGQPSLSSRTANYTGQISAQGLSLSGYPASLAFDPSGNLWVGDTFNYRVLRFPASSLNTTGGGISADIVIGQQSLTTAFPTLLTNTPAAQQTLDQFAVLGGIAFDPQGHLFVGDSLARVLVFANPTAVTSNASADRLMGVYPPGSTNPGPVVLGETTFNSPEGIFMIPDGSGNAYIGVVDTNYNRATIFPPYSQWPAAPAPPQAVVNGVVGQGNFTTVSPNAETIAVTTPPASASSLSGPLGAVYLPSTKELFIADSGNNRVVVIPNQPITGAPVGFTNATRVLGQSQFTQSSINYIEGKEFQFAFQSGTTVTYDAGIALDITGPVPHLYVADPYNHRVLGFRDARKITPGLHADLVIGQPDFGTALCNYPTGDNTKPSRTSLCRPYDVVVDSQGNLYVADSGNGRVLRFPAPFAFSGSGMQQADLVLGQQDFTSQVLDPTAATMKTPYGLAISGNNGLLVSDAAFNRVLYFPFTSNGGFTALTDNGKAATKVFGQQNFTGSSSCGSGCSSNAQLSVPRHIAADTSGRLYVADTGNNRILIFDDPNSPLTPPAGDIAPLALTQGIRTPSGVYVNPATGEVWVANSGSGTVVRYPIYDTLSQNPTCATNQVPACTIVTITDAAIDPNQNSGGVLYSPIATVQDQYGDLFVADSGNRIVTYYQAVQVVNAANYVPNTSFALAPNTIATLFPVKNGSPTQFGPNTASYTPAAQIASTLGDVQVTVNGTPASLFYVSPGQINFVIPWSAPTSGTAEVDVIQASTGQILGSTQMTMGPVAPGVFQCPISAAPLRQACILNEDNSLNSFTNPAQRGHVVQIFGTGQGLVNNPPPEGVPASGAISAIVSPRVLINGLYPEQYPQAPGDPPNQQFVQYFGLAPGFLGLWQLNLQIPMGVAPNNNVQFEVNLNNVFDTYANTGFHMSVAVK